jgi:CheY-like chemotaxis protein
MARILIVEDYPNIRQTYETVLSHEGHDVTAASDGREALKIVGQQPPDLILLDLLMADIGGLEFLRAYNLKDHPATKVIVVSNLSSPELAKEAMELGASKYLTKSNFSPKQLAAVVKDTLRGR